MPTPSLSKVSWQQIQPTVNQVDESLSKAIESQMGARNLSKPIFWRISYPYGELVVKHSRFCLPKNVDAAAAAQFNEEFKSATVPLALVLKGSVEIFRGELESPDYPLASFRILWPGEMFGVFETNDRLYGSNLMTVSTYSISSGARSVWIAAPVDDRRLPSKLAKVVYPNSTAACTWDGKHHSHFQLIRMMSGKSDWTSDLLVFPDTMLQMERQYTGPLSDHVQRIGWSQSAVHRQQFGVDENVLALCQKEVYFISYYPMLQHIVSIVRGQMPAFRGWFSPSDCEGPFSTFQKNLVQAMEGIGTRYPFVLAPTQLSKPGDFGFYSFSVPSLPVEVTLDRSPVLQCADMATILGKRQCHEYGSLPQEPLLPAQFSPRARLKFFCHGRLGPGNGPDRRGQPFADHKRLTFREFDALAPDEENVPEHQRNWRGSKLCCEDGFFNACVRIEIINEK